MKKQPRCFFLRQSFHWLFTRSYSFAYPIGFVLFTNFNFDYLCLTFIFLILLIFDCRDSFNYWSLSDRVHFVDCSFLIYTCLSSLNNYGSKIRRQKVTKNQSPTNIFLPTNLFLPSGHFLPTINFFRPIFLSTLFLNTLNLELNTLALYFGFMCHLGETKMWVDRSV